jgi:hypothetical protein
VLACTLMTESHTGEYIARLLEEIHTKFGIDETVVRTTTDNGSNFCSSFQNFGKPPARIESIAVDDELVENEMDPMSQPFPSASLFKVTVDDVITGESDGPEFIPICDTLLPEQVIRDGRYNLPAHARCAAHTLNLIGGSDVNKNKNLYHKNYVAAMEKATSIWNFHAHSDRFRMAVKKVSKFYVPESPFMKLTVYSCFSYFSYCTLCTVQCIRSTRLMTISF